MADITHTMRDRNTVKAELAKVREDALTATPDQFEEIIATIDRLQAELDSLPKGTRGRQPGLIPSNVKLEKRKEIRSAICEELGGNKVVVNAHIRILEDKETKKRTILQVPESSYFDPPKDFDKETLEQMVAERYAEWEQAELAAIQAETAN